MKLPEVFQIRGAMNSFPGFFAAALVRTVIHDGHAWMERVHNGFGIGLKEPMVGGEVEVNRSNQVIRTDQLALFSFCEVAKVDEAEFPVSNQYSKRARVFAGVGFRLRLRSADGIG